MTGNLLEQGASLMLYGMGTVFVFLTLLIMTTHIMSWAILRFFPEVPSNIEPKSIEYTGSGDQTPIAVISAAIHHYRKKHKK